MKRFCSYVWRSPVVLFLLTLLLVMSAGAATIQSPAFFEGSISLLKVFVFGGVFASALIGLFGIADCLGAEEESNTKLLWIIIMLLAPILGPLLWLTCGRSMPSTPPRGSSP